MSLLERLGLAALGLVLACSAARSGESRSGSLRVEWTGADTGKLTAPAVALWCDSLKLLEVRAVRGDTGIAVALYPVDSPGAGTYPILPPQRAGSKRPAAAVAVRWFGETAISGFRSDSGAVTLDATGPGTTSGRFTGQLRSTTEPGRLAMTGSFSGLSVEPAPRDCAGRREGVAPADSGEISDEELLPEPDAPLGDEEAGGRRS